VIQKKEVRKGRRGLMIRLTEKSEILSLESLLIAVGSKSEVEELARH
jgi:hypothetical protein